MNTVLSYAEANEQVEQLEYIDLEFGKPKPVELSEEVQLVAEASKLETAKVALTESE